MFSKRNCASLFTRAGAALAVLALCVGVAFADSETAAWAPVSGDYDVGAVFTPGPGGAMMSGGDGWADEVDLMIAPSGTIVVNGEPIAHGVDLSDTLTVEMAVRNRNGVWECDVTVRGSDSSVLGSVSGVVLAGRPACFQAAAAQVVALVVQ